MCVYILHHDGSMSRPLRMVRSKNINKSVQVIAAWAVNACIFEGMNLGFPLKLYGH